MSKSRPARVASGAIPYRLAAEGKVEVLLVTTSRSKRWSIPKGKEEPHLSLADNAAKEAFEEAGVVGEIYEDALGMFRTVQRRKSGSVTLKVWVYLMKVTETLEVWPEMKLRKTKWVSCREAEELLSEPFLKKICRNLETIVFADASDSHP